MSLSESERCLIQAQQRQVRSLQTALKALTLAVLSEGAASDEEVRRELGVSDNHIHNAEVAVEKVMEIEANLHRPAERSGPRRESRRSRSFYHRETRRET